MSPWPLLSSRGHEEKGKLVASAQSKQDMAERNICWRRDFD